LTGITRNEPRIIGDTERISAVINISDGEVIGETIQNSAGISIADIMTIGDFISIKMVSSTPKYPVFGGRDAFAYKGTLGGSIMGV
jgi:hypothetical protein